MKKIECKCWCNFSEFERKFPLMEVAFTLLEALRGEAQAEIKNSVHKAFGGVERRDLPESSTRLPVALCWPGLTALLICQAQFMEESRQRTFRNPVFAVLLNVHRR